MTDATGPQPSTRPPVPSRSPDRPDAAPAFVGGDALPSSEARLEALVEASADVIYRMNADWSEMQPLEGHQLVASNVEPVTDWLERNIPADEHARIREHVRRAIDGRTTFTLEHRVLRPDGSVGWTQSRAVPILDDEGALVEWLGTASDITARKLAEQALRQSEAKYRALFESIDDAFCLLEVLFDKDGRPVDHRFLELNPAFERHTGLTGAVVGRTARELMPGHDPEWFERYGRIVTTGQPERFEFPEPVLDRWFDVFAWRVGGPALRQVAALFKDISERKRFEQALREAKDQAERANLAKDDFLAALSHELRTPLTPALAVLSFWESNPSVQPAALRDDLATARRNLMLEARLIDDLLDLTRITRGKLALHLESVDVCELVTAVVTICAPDAEAQGVALIVRFDTKPCDVEADPGRLQQVLWNLLKNAIKFTPAGGRIEVIVREGEPGQIEVAVADSGIGMAPEMVPRVFRPFEQGSADSVRRFGGLGLGLAISRALIEAHGGAIAARSDGPGRGSVFSMTLARTDNASAVSRTPQGAAAPGTAESPSASAATPVRVLLVEDHEDTAVMMEKLLSTFGHTVTVAGTVADAVAVLENNGGDIDLLVSDLGLPDGSGLDIVRAARGRFGLDLPAIAITGYGMEKDIARARDAGFAVHLTKPLNFAQLEEAIARLCRA